MATKPDTFYLRQDTTIEVEIGGDKIYVHGPTGEGGRLFYPGEFVENEEVRVMWTGEEWIVERK
jgi:hypothetical protein